MRREWLFTCEVSIEELVLHFNDVGDDAVDLNAADESREENLLELLGLERLERCHP